MATAILLSALLPLVFEKAESLIEHQLVKLWSNRDLKRELRKLQRVLATIRSVLQDAEAKQAKDESLSLWLSDLKDAAYDAEDLLDDINLRFLRQQWMEDQESNMRLKVHDFFSPSHNPLIFHARMSRRAKDINLTINELAEERYKFNLRGNDNYPQQAMEYRRPQTHSYVPESEFVGREADVERIIELLIVQETRKDVSVLPIVGMGGLGKTTLLQKVYNHKRVTDHFELRMWVAVPDDFSVEKIVKIMIENGTSSKWELSNLDSLQRKLAHVINGKRYLLALDDVWNEDRQKWEALRVLLTFGACGSTVVVTTRSGTVSSIVRTLDDYMLAGLSDDECWTLFKRKAFVDGVEEDPSLVEIGRLIVKKCGGLPLAVMALGGLMPQFKGDETKWKMLTESDLWDLPVGRDEILPALRLSYHHLPPHLKQCFAFCAIFPRGDLIWKDDLIDIWMANEFIPSDDKGIKSEFGDHAVFNDLEQRYFFQITSTDDSPYISFEMHDLIHDLAKSIMGSECCCLDKWEDNSTRKFRHMIIDPKYGLPGSTDFLSSLEDKITSFGTSETIRTLLIYNTEWRSLICQNINYLRALRLQDCEMSVFSISICKLRHLRYLDLCDNKFQTLPEAMSTLFNLQTLDLRRCRELRRLPKSIRLMRSLIHLYLDGCHSLECMPSGMGVLKRLRKVTRYVVGSEVGSGGIIDLKHWNLHDRLQLVGLENVRSASDAEEARLGSKENLRVLKLEWGEGSTRRMDDEEVLQRLRPHQNLKKLTINNYSGKKMPTWLLGDSMLLKNLVELELYGLSRCEHLPQLGQLFSLEVLAISGMNSAKQVGGGRGLVSLPEGMGRLPALKYLGLRDLPMLRTSFLDGYESLKTLVIEGCPGVESSLELLTLQRPSLRIIL